MLVVRARAHRRHARCPRRRHRRRRRARRLPHRLGGSAGPFIRRTASRRLPGRKNGASRLTRPRRSRKQGAGEPGRFYWWVNWSPRRIRPAIELSVLAPGANISCSVLRTKNAFSPSPAPRLPVNPEGSRHELSAGQQPEAVDRRGLATQRQLLQEGCVAAAQDVRDLARAYSAAGACAGSATTTRFRPAALAS